MTCGKWNRRLPPLDSPAFQDEWKAGTIESSASALAEFWVNISDVTESSSPITNISPGYGVQNSWIRFRGKVPFRISGYDNVKAGVIGCWEMNIILTGSKIGTNDGARDLLLDLEFPV